MRLASVVRIAHVHEVAFGAHQPDELLLLIRRRAAFRLHFDEQSAVASARVGEEQVANPGPQSLALQDRGTDRITPTPFGILNRCCGQPVAPADRVPPADQRLLASALLVAPLLRRLAEESRAAYRWLPRCGASPGQ